MTTNKSPDKKIGGIDLNAKSAQISDSSIAGRDINGITGEELEHIIETLLKYFPKSYLKNPDELDRILNEFRQYYEQLQEYKELHNKINEILTALEPFRTEMYRLNFLSLSPELERLRTLWLPVSIRVEELLNWSQTIKYIGKPFHLGDNVKEGEPWAIQFSEMRDKINQLGLSTYSIGELDHLDFKKIYSFQRARNKVRWLNNLFEFTSQLSNATFINLDIADKQLRQTAQELLNLSNKAMSKY